MTQIVYIHTRNLNIVTYAFRSRIEHVLRAVTFIHLRYLKAFSIEMKWFQI